MKYKILLGLIVLLLLCSLVDADRFIQDSFVNGSLGGFNLSVWNKGGASPFLMNNTIVHDGDGFSTFTGKVDGSYIYSKRGLNVNVTCMAWVYIPTGAIGGTGIPAITGVGDNAGNYVIGLRRATSTTNYVMTDGGYTATSVPVVYDKFQRLGFHVYPNGTHAYIKNTTIIISKAGSAIAFFGMGDFSTPTALYMIYDNVSCWNGSITDEPVPSGGGATTVTITNSTYNVTSAYQNQTVWRTNQSAIPKSFDLTPTITFNISEAGNCTVSPYNYNYTTAKANNVNWTCSGGNSVSQTCTYPNDLSIGINTIYFACAKPDGTGETSQNSTSGALNISIELDIFPPVCQLMNRTPTNLTDNITGPLSVIWNCTDDSGVNVTKDGDHYGFFITRTVDAIILAQGIPNYWSNRYPNNSLGVIGTLTPPYKIWRALGRNEGYWYENLPNLSDCTGYSPCYQILNDTFSYAIEDGEYGHLTVTNTSTVAIFNYTHPITDVATFRQSVYISYESMVKEQKKNYSISNNNYVLTKRFDAEAYRGTANYTMNSYRNIGSIGTPIRTLRAFYCNSSYNPLGSIQVISSSNCVLINSLNPTDLDIISFTDRNSSYSKGTYAITDGYFGGIKATAEFYIEYESPENSAGKYYTVKYANGSTNVPNINFTNSNVSWITTNGGTTWVQANFTPDIFTTSLRKVGDDFEFGIWVRDNKGNIYKNFTFFTDSFSITNHPITNPLILAYNSSSKINDMDRNGTHTGIMQVYIGVSTDPDAVGNVTHNLSLRNPDGSVNTTINGSFKSFNDADIWITFNSSSVSDGKYRMNITATSTEGNVKSYMTFDNFTIDNHYPAITWSGDTSINNSNITVNWIYMNVTYSDIAFMNLTFYVDSILVNTSFSSTFYNKTSITDGIHTYYAQVCDQIGQCNQTEIRTIRADTLNPIVYLVQPNANALIVDLDANMECYATDANGIRNITLYIWNSSNPQQLVYNLTNSSDKINYTFTGVFTGNYTWNCYAYDNFGLFANGTNRTFYLEEPTVNLTLSSGFSKITFIPSRPNSTNVTPINQTALRGILNATNLEVNQTNFQIYIDYIGYFMNRLIDSFTDTTKGWKELNKSSTNSTWNWTQLCITIQTSDPSIDNITTVEPYYAGKVIYNFNTTRDYEYYNGTNILNQSWVSDCPKVNYVEFNLSRYNLSRNFTGFNRINISFISLTNKTQDAIKMTVIDNNSVMANSSILYVNQTIWRSLTTDISALNLKDIRFIRVYFENGTYFGGSQTQNGIVYLDNLYAYNSSTYKSTGFTLKANCNSNYSSAVTLSNSYSTICPINGSSSRVIWLYADYNNMPLGLRWNMYYRGS